MSAAIFWISAAIIAYTYVGYAVLVALYARRHTQLPLQAPATPAVTVVIAAYNEARRIGERVRNVLALDYPADKLSVVVVSDGSEDGTERAAAVGDARVRVVSLPHNVGKAAALNAAFVAVETEYAVFSDARQRFAPDALRRLMAPFADPRVGAVTGELEIAERMPTGAKAATDGLYWRMEKRLREGEARVGWLHTVTGAVYALRTELFRALPAGLLLDDMWIPLHVAFAGRRIWMARDAIAYDEPSASVGEEYRRKLRTLAGNWQLIARMPRLLDPRANPVFFPWLSHKLLRLVAPWALVAAWWSSARAEGAIYEFAFYAQTAAYAGAAFALVAPRIAARIPLLPTAASFVVLNFAALLALPACLAIDAGRLWKKH
ncbi:MAG TPA: glycosyltransferase family 2 protein [Rudaea sp.]|nr:glycosyltransferase family 2 protein [Rudaea sp.]